jgi:asparagine synthase (glutamine-hydrolysing)
MCGITGVAALGRRNLDKKIEPILALMRESIVHRGPDDHGIYSDDKIGLGFQRLSILDLSELGHQPMFDESRRYAIIFNGEIYNYRELHKELLPDFSPKSHSDTEILLQLYIRYGQGMLHKLNGMFAFAIWDIEKKELFIARDRVGIKPLFYAVHDDCLFFGSEMKTLFAGGVPKSFNEDCLEELLCFRYVAGENTPFADVNRLLPGHFLRVSNGNYEIGQWWSYPEVIRAGKSPAGDEIRWFRETFDQSVEYRTIADVPVGVLLSGGLDSSSIAASLGLHGHRQTNTFTVRFREERFDEGDFARNVADRYEMQYNELFIPQDKIFNLAKEAMRYSDEPMYHSSDLFIMAISRFAKPKVTILLSGEGGDETLGGYVRYRPLRYKSLLRFGFLVAPLLGVIPAKGRLKKLLRFLNLRDKEKYILYNTCETLPDDLKEIGFKVNAIFPFREKVVKESKNIYPADDFRRAMYYDMHAHLSSLLDRNDRMTMAASIECRVPFLDYRLVEALGGMRTEKLVPDSEPKSLLRRTFGPRLPKALMQKAKWGFGVPWNQYYRTIPEYKEYLDRLASHPVVTRYFERPEKLKKAVDAFLAGEDRQAAVIIQLVNICIWYDLNFANF